jgi:hypothetical protein
VTLYGKYIKMREELLRHKWIESEKAGYDIGAEQALIDWLSKYRKDWLEHIEKEENHDNRT